MVRRREIFFFGGKITAASLRTFGDSSRDVNLPLPTRRSHICPMLSNYALFEITRFTRNGVPQSLEKGNFGRGVRPPRRTNGLMKTI
jgi:hypothetical protein